jgi:hypothetical protein
VITLGAGAEATTTAPEPAAPVAPTAEATPATVAIDAPARLQRALDSLAGGYHFRTVVSVGGAEVLVAEGERVGEGTRLTIWSSGTSLSYVILPEGTWVVPDGGEWEALDSAPATTDPLLALRTPSGVTGTSTDGVTATLTATVSAVALGVPSDGVTDVTVGVVGDALTNLSHTATVDGQTANVATTFAPVVDATPVVAPV